MSSTTGWSAIPEPEVFVLADRALHAVVEQIADDQWSIQVPAWFQRNARQGEMTLREIVNYHAYDDAWVPDMLAGKTMAEAGATKYDGDLLGAHPKDAFAAFVEAAVMAASHFETPEQTVHCSFGDFPARHYFWQINMFRALRARDIARLIGANEQLPARLVQGVWDEVAPNAEEWRAIGIFGPRVAVAEEASLQDRLLALTGREP